MSDLMEYIKVQWDDIHHSRNQEWHLLAILGGIFLGLSKESLDLRLRTALVILGLLICLMAIYVSLAHWKIFYSKRRVITQCEKALGINVKLYRASFPVQGVLVSVYVLLASFFFGWMLFIFTENFCFSVVAGLVLFLSSLVATYLYALKQRRKMDTDEQNVLVLKCGQIPDCRRGCGFTFPKVPLYAESEDLMKCLGLLGPRPLKLVSNSLYNDESSWEKDRWSFTAKNNAIVDKKVLLNTKDVFQFSVANKQSVQHLHKHEEVAEILVSDSRMKIFYGSEDAENVLEVPKGALIVPPGVKHKIELGGLTFVFQCATGGGTVHGDKQLVNTD